MVNLLNATSIKDKLKDRILENLDSYTSIDKNNVYHLNVSVADLVDEYLEEKKLEEPKLFITSTAFVKMNMLIQSTSTEIGWYGIVEPHQDINTYIITDILVYPQTVTGATVEQDETRMFDFEMSLTDEQVNNKRFHGHSHVNMGVGPSTTDETFYQEILSQVNDYFIILIKNKRNEQTVRFYDIVNGVYYSDLPIYIIDEQGNNINDWYDDMLENVHRYQPPVVKQTYTTAKTGKTKAAKKEPIVSEQMDFDDILPSNPYDDYEDETYGAGYYEDYWKSWKGWK